MTLNTDIYVLNQVDPAEVFARAQALLGPRADGLPHATYTNSDHGYTLLANEPGQNLPAWLMMRYRPGQPLATAESNATAMAAHKHASWCDDDCDGSEDAEQVCWLSFDFDTAYGYRDADGRDCNSLHARYIREMGAWFDSLGVRWQWRNEYSGEIFDGYDGLAKFAHDGDQAQGWFSNVASPAIAAMIAGER